MLVPDWKEAWSWLSVQLAAGIAALATAYDYLPAVRENLPEGWVKYAIPLIILGRVIDQTKRAAK
jgi:hypothetical protein